MGRRDSQLSRRAERGRRQRRRPRRARDDVPRSRAACRMRSISFVARRALSPKWAEASLLSRSRVRRAGEARRCGASLRDGCPSQSRQRRHRVRASAARRRRRRRRGDLARAARVPGSARSRRAPVDCRALRRLHSCDSGFCARVLAPRPCSRLRSTPRAFRLLNGRRYDEALAAFQRPLDSSGRGARRTRSPGVWPRASSRRDNLKTRSER